MSHEETVAAYRLLLDERDKVIQVQCEALTAAEELIASLLVRVRRRDNANGPASVRCFRCGVSVTRMLAHDCKEATNATP